MIDTFALTYTGAPFSLFGTAHIVALLIVLGASVLTAVLFSGRDRPRLREGFRYGLIGLHAINLISWNWWQAAVGIWSPAFSLPLQICTLSGWLCILLLRNKNALLYQVLYFWGFAGAGHALFTPDLGGYGFPHYCFWVFFSAHGAIIVTVIFVTCAEGLRLRWSSIWKAALLTNALMLLVAPVNLLTGGNYLFIARKPDFPSALDYLDPWPWYILGLQCIGIISFGLCYLPFAINDWHAHRQPQPSNEFSASKI
jgi:hypothetical integral membrane protein (TIGR02206 family)